MIPYDSMRARLTFLFLPLALAAFWLLPASAQAANRYWVGSAGGLWNSSANWASSAGICSGTGGASVPGASDVAIFTSSCTSNVTIDPAADLAGLDIQSGYTGTVTQGSGITVTIGSSNFSQAAGTFTGAAVAIDINGSFSLTGGTFTSTSGTLTVSGNWTHSGGTFTHNSGSVTLDGSTQTLNDDNTFYNLTKTVTSADTLTVEASSTQTISNTLTLDGTSSATLSLRSSSSGTKFTLAPASATTVTYLDVKDSQASTSNITCSTGCTNSGGNDDGEAEPRWVFSSTNTAPTVSSLRSIKQVNDTIQFETDVNDSNGDKTQLLVEYSTDQSSWKKATISKVSASQGDVTVTASATYPIQSIDTDSGKVTLKVTWNAVDNFQNEESKIYLRLTPYDGTDAGTAVISESFAVDTRAPVISNIFLKARTSTSLTPAWTPEAEKNFDKYVLCYGTDLTKVKNCTLTGKNAAKQWTFTQDSKLATFATSQTTITGLKKNTTYHILLKATDTFGHTSTLLLQSVKTSNAPAPPFLTVTGVEGATIDLSWTATDSKSFVRYELCYGQNFSLVTGQTTGSGQGTGNRHRQGRPVHNNCRPTGNPSGAVLKTFAPKTNTKTTLTGLKEGTLYYAKIWLRDSKYGLIAGNNTSATTCKAGERRVKGKCTVITPPVLSLDNIEGEAADLSWTKYDSKTVTGYDLCYGQTQSRVTGTSCLSTGSPAGAKLVRLSATTLSSTLKDLSEKTLYYAKIWVRDSIHGTKAGNSVSFTTCAAGETLVKGKCVAPPPPPVCSDGLDNDNDGKTDFPNDPGCASATGTDETDAVVEEEPTPTPEVVVPPPEVPPALTTTSEIVESFTEFVEETFGETVATVVKKVIEVAKKVVQTVVRVVKAVAEVVPTQPAVVVPVAVATAVAVVASTGLVTVVPNFSGELFYLWQRLMQGLLGLAGARKRYPWGRVVDAASGTPLPQTIVRILDRQTQRLRDTAITDGKGDFTSLLPAGQYRFEAVKPGWHLDPSPARFLNILSHQQVYDGNFVDVKKEGVVSIIIAMRPQVKAAVEHLALRSILQRVERFLTALSWPLLIFGSILSTLALVKEQTTLNIGIGILYVVLIGAKLYVQRSRHPTTGQVKDAATSSPLKEALVQLYNAETGRLMATKVTSESGQFVLVPPPGVYTVIVSKAGYATYRESHVVIEPRKQKALAMTFVLTPA